MVSSVLGRMTALTTLSLLLLASQAFSLLGELSDAHDDNYAAADSAWLQAATAPVPGFKALYGIQDRVIDVWKRDCLPNGTNYCFGDNTNYCTSCGTCCTQGTYCCSSSQTCCGTGCCASGETCSDGKCIGTSSSSSSSPAGGSVATATSTVLETVTRVATQVATVLIAEVDISTVVSTVEVTVTDAATQTNVVWITVTQAAAAKRTASPGDPSLQGIDVVPRELGASIPVVLETIRAAWGAFAPRGLGAKLNHLVDDLPPIRRADPPATSTTTVVVTQTTAVASIVSTTVTAETTSFVRSTILETITRALNAKFTTTVTSTLTLTSRPPITQTVTNTASVILSPTTSLPPVTSTASATPPPSEPTAGLSTPTIAGIAAGSAAFIIVVAAALAFCWFRRRKSKVGHTWDGDPTHSYLNYDPELSSPGQTLHKDRYQQAPTVPQISFAPNPAHHSVQFQPPATAASATPQTAALGNELAADDISTAVRHQRTGSGFTTLVSGAESPGLGAAAIKKNEGFRVSMATLGSQPHTPRGSRQPQELAAVTTPPAEVDANEAPRWFEVDAMHGTAVGGLGDRAGFGAEQDHEREQQRHPQGHPPGNYIWAEQAYNSQELDGHQYAMPEELDSSSPGIALGHPQDDIPPRYQAGYQYRYQGRGA